MLSTRLCWFLLLFPLTLAGCPTTSNDDDSADDDDDVTADDDDATADDDDTTADDDDDNTPPPDDDDSAPDGTFQGQALDPFTLQPAVGATVSVAQDSSLDTVTDAAGEYSIFAPALPEIDIRAALGTRVPLTCAALQGINISPTSGLLHPLIERAELENFHGVAGIAYDSSKAGVWVTVVDSGGQTVPDTTIDLSAAYGASMIAQDGPPELGNTLSATASQIVFFNVDADADIDITFNDPNGMTCAGRTPITPIADEVTFVTFVCE